MSGINHFADASQMVALEEAYNQYKQAKIKYNEARFVPALLNLGAELIRPGVYRLGDWDCYIDGTYCRNIKNNQKLRLKKFLGVE